MSNTTFNMNIHIKTILGMYCSLDVNNSFELEIPYWTTGTAHKQDIF